LAARAKAKAHDGARLITGETLYIDGGYHRPADVARRFGVGLSDRAKTPSVRKSQRI